MCWYSLTICCGLLYSNVVCVVHVFVPVYFLNHLVISVIYDILYTVASLYHHFTKAAVHQNKALCAINVLRLAVEKYREAPTKLTSLHADLAQVAGHGWMELHILCINYEMLALFHLFP